MYRFAPAAVLYPAFRQNRFYRELDCFACFRPETEEEPCRLRNQHRQSPILRADCP